MPYLGEALLVFEEGGRADEIDAEIRAFGMPAGPLELLDTVGLDVAQLAARVMLGAFGERFGSPQALDRLTEAGRMGRKSGSGFYRYGPGGEKRGADREAAKIAGAAKRRREAPIAGRPAGRLTPVQERLLLPMINEAAIVLGEGIARSPADVDLALVLGAGFPPFRGGLLRYADSLGTANLAERLELLAERHGRRFAPGDFLRDLARQGKSFHSGG
jgi:3-hydroxyacyl-CoA dehydrogenase